MVLFVMVPSAGGLIMGISLICFTPLITSLGLGTTVTGPAAGGSWSRPTPLARLGLSGRIRSRPNWRYAEEQRHCEDKKRCECSFHEGFILLPIEEMLQMAGVG